MFDRLKTRIIILSSPRTGSSALVWEIYNFFKEKGIIFSTLFEPHIIGSDKKKFDERPTISELEFRKIVEGENFILKVHALDLEKYYPSFVFKYLDDPNYSIVKLQRKNFIDQCISLYISLTINVWSSRKTNKTPYENLSIPMDTVKIYHAINTALAYNRALTKIKRFDLSIDYEDFNFKEGEFVKNTKVKNYDELRKVITHIANLRLGESKF